MHFDERVSIQLLGIAQYWIHRDFKDQLGPQPTHRGLVVHGDEGSQHSPGPGCFSVRPFLRP